MENDIDIYNRIINFYNGSYINNKKEDYDISYNKWVKNDNNIKILCSHINIPNNEEGINKIIQRRDYPCELKLIKWITEDLEHKKYLIKIPNSQKKLNKYEDILPYEYNCVFIDENNQNFDNYINASYIDGPFEEDQKLFIATQDPLKETIFIFWKMIITYKINLIINFSNTPENINQIYFPIKKDENLIITNINNENEKIILSLKNEEILIENSLILRIIKVNDEIEINQIQILNWDEHEIPNDEILVKNIINTLINKINENRIKYKNIPILIHCVGGVGKTGTFISIYQIIKCLELIKEIKKDYILNIFNVVRKLREQRYSMVTDISQYKFIYIFCLNWIKENIMKKSINENASIN